MGVEPSDETLSLLEAIREDDQPRLAGWITGAEPSLQGHSAQRPAARDLAPAHNLPRQFTSFVGRAKELAVIGARLTEPETSLVTVTGPGGIGKTRLALAAAAVQVGRFANGVFFVPLAAIVDVDQIAPAIAEALRFPFDSQSDVLPSRRSCWVGWRPRRRCSRWTTSSI